MVREGCASAMRRVQSPALLTLPILVYTLYRLDRGRHAAIQETLATRRSARLAAPAQPPEAALAAGR